MFKRDWTKSFQKINTHKMQEFNKTGTGIPVTISKASKGGPISVSSLSCYCNMRFRWVHRSGRSRRTWRRKRITPTYLRDDPPWVHLDVKTSSTPGGSNAASHRRRSKLGRLLLLVPVLRLLPYKDSLPSTCLTCSQSRQFPPYPTFVPFQPPLSEEQVTNLTSHSSSRRRKSASSSVLFSVLSSTHHIVGSHRFRVSASHSSSPYTLEFSVCQSDPGSHSELARVRAASVAAAGTSSSLHSLLQVN